MYKLKKPYIVVNVLLVGLGFVLTLMRWLNVVNGKFLVINAEITSHITSFSLSILVYLVVVSLWLTSGVRFRLVGV